MMMVDRKRGRASPPKTVSGKTCSHFFDVGSEEAVEWADLWLKRPHTYQVREVQEPEKTIYIKFGNREAVEW